MQMNEIIALVTGGIILIITVVYLAINQKKGIIEWLKYAVSEAEKMLGNGTGRLKLRMVYDWFCEGFPIAAAILPFKVFSAWVDIALNTMNTWLETNSDINNYITEKKD